VNPLVPAPATDHNDDPDLRFDEATGEYAMLSLETRRPDSQSLVELRSRDLISWCASDSRALLAFDDPALGVETLYRSTGAMIGDELVVWYSMQYAP
jgi:hypothetical protein